jgi:hypothetical protein
MSKLGELGGTVEVSIDGTDGVAVSTFAIPIAVMSQDRAGDTLTVAIGTPEETLRAGLREAAHRAVDLALGGISSADVHPVTDPSAEHHDHVTLLGETGS